MARNRIVLLLAMIALVATGCSGWRGLNSLPLPGVQGLGPGSFEVKAEMPDVDNIEPNSRVRVGDVNVGTVTRIERKGWHALVTMRLNKDVELPANATAKLGQTSLLGSQHIELAPPTDEPPRGRLQEGSLISYEQSGAYPTTEQALAAIALLLNGGGFDNLQDITEALSTAFAGRENDLRSLIEQLDRAIGYLDEQKYDIIAASESLNNLVGQFAEQKPVVDKALRTIPEALEVLKDQRANVAEALAQLGRFSELAEQSVDQTKEALVQELKDLQSVLRELANSGPALTRALSFLPTFPFPKETLTNWMRGDYANLTLILDMTLSRIDAGFFTGTRFECNLTWLELQWGRTIGQMPSPCNHHVPPPGGNPLLVPYRWDQGP
ncbi:Lipoprotein LprN [Mycolicibacterium hassiacum DSM 44199]|nr:mammalian cell entry protein [Mycolicibacterium hassiacum DSM 44199]VCT91474.1 Lipoprotein LprN [Mycolicibacterium hassiacum DSM 44199]